MYLKEAAWRFVLRVAFAEKARVLTSKSAFFSPLQTDQFMVLKNRDQFLSVIHTTAQRFTTQTQSTSLLYQNALTIPIVQRKGGTRLNENCYFFFTAF